MPRASPSDGGIRPADLGAGKGLGKKGLSCARPEQRHTAAPSQEGQSRLLLLMVLAARPTLAEVPLADLSLIMTRTGAFNRPEQRASRPEAPATPSRQASSSDEVRSSPAVGSCAPKRSVTATPSAPSLAARATGSCAAPPAEATSGRSRLRRTGPRTARSHTARVSRCNRHVIRCLPADPSANMFYELSQLPHPGDRSSPSPSCGTVSCGRMTIRKLMT